jgi:molybdopterin/thiamine biosynthesis adenylyltransferase
MENEKRIVLVGAGGIGTWLAEGVVRLLEWKFPGSALLIVDGDNFEKKNLERQSFTQIGNKASVKALELTEKFHQTLVIPVPKWVVSDDHPPTDEESNKIKASELLAEGDIVLAVVDNFSARKILFDAASKFNNIDVFTGGNDDALFGSIYHYQRRNGIDITAHPVETHPEYQNPPDRNPGEMSCQERAEVEGGTQILATNMAVASMILGRIQHTIVSQQNPEQTEIYFDLALGMAQPFNRMVESNINITQ